MCLDTHIHIGKPSNMQQNADILMPYTVTTATVCGC